MRLNRNYILSGHTSNLSLQMSITNNISCQIVVKHFYCATDEWNAAVDRPQTHLKNSLANEIKHSESRKRDWIIYINISIQKGMLAAKWSSADNFRKCKSNRKAEGSPISFQSCWVNATWLVHPIFRFEHKMFRNISRLNFIFNKFVYLDK